LGLEGRNIRDALTFEAWYDLHCNDVTCLAAELGCDREACFDLENFTEKCYEGYLNDFQQ
jgi:hypothetical protein